MHKKAQGSLEYLLLIGGAILVAVIVIGMIVGIGGTGGSESQKSAKDALCTKYGSNPELCNNSNINFSGGEYECLWNQLTTPQRCESGGPSSGSFFNLGSPLFSSWSLESGSCDPEQMQCTIVLSGSPPENLFVVIQSDTITVSINTESDCTLDFDGKYLCTVPLTAEQTSSLLEEKDHTISLGDSLTNLTATANFTLSSNMNAFCGNGVCDSGESMANCAADCIVIPEPPTNLTATPEPGKIVLSWTGSTTQDIDGYNVYRGTDVDAIETRFPNNPITVNTATDNFASNNITYYYEVKTVKDGIESTAATASAIITP